MQHVYIFFFTKESLLTGTYVLFNSVRINLRLKFSFLQLVQIFSFLSTTSPNLLFLYWFNNFAFNLFINSNRCTLWSTLKKFALCCERQSAVWLNSEKATKSGALNVSRVTTTPNHSNERLISHLIDCLSNHHGLTTLTFDGSDPARPAAFRLIQKSRKKAAVC
jgi:hypothetical protein